MTIEEKLIGPVDALAARCAVVALKTKLESIWGRSCRVVLGAAFERENK